jgi:hypothetical protein
LIFKEGWGVCITSYWLAFSAGPRQHSDVWFRAPRD